jgi:MerR family transcriptional regulator, redox-sensitive transcriptional activator SoxR
MPPLTISDVARRVGLRASAIRYYEQIGLLPTAQRISGQRRYDSTVLHRLSVVQQAQRLGFTLEEVRKLFFGYSPTAPASKRWQRLSRQKLAELDAQMYEIKSMQRRLREMIRKCRCSTLDQCGRGILRSECAGAGTTRQRIRNTRSSTTGSANFRATAS